LEIFHALGWEIPLYAHHAFQFATTLKEGQKQLVSKSENSGTKKVTPYVSVFTALDWISGPIRAPLNFTKPC